MSNITDAQFNAAWEAYVKEVHFGDLQSAVRKALEDAEAAAWSRDISKAPKDKKILAQLKCRRVVLAYYANDPHMLNPGWQSMSGYIADSEIKMWRLAPTPPKEPTT